MVAEIFLRCFRKPFHGNIKNFHDALHGSRFSFFSNHAFCHNKIVSAMQSIEAMGHQSKNKKHNITGTSNDDETNVQISRLFN
jgi:hypothetical protein